MSFRDLKRITERGNMTRLVNRWVEDRLETGVIGSYGVSEKQSEW